MTKVAILHPGEMGATIARALRESGIACSGFVAGRSAATQARAREAGIVLCATLAEAVRGSDLIFSLVPASEATAVAAQVAAALGSPEPGAARPLFLDANSTDPRLVPRLAAIAEQAGMDFVDGALVGPASRVGQDTVLLLSGAQGGRVAEALALALAVRVVGTEPGQASGLKLALSVVTKGLVALVLETLDAAHVVGAEDHATALLASVYPGVFEVARRVLPTYPRHIVRRVAEVQDAADWLRSAGRAAPMACATADLFTRLEAAGLDPDRDQSFEAVTQDFLLRNVLAKAARVSSPGGA